MKATVHILREKHGIEHHGIVEVRRWNGEIIATLQETILERIDCGDCVEDTAFILEYEGELYQGGRNVTLTPEEYAEAEHELDKAESSVSQSILSPIHALRQAA